MHLDTFNLYDCVCYLHVRHHKQVGDFGCVIDETVPVQQINGSTSTNEKHGQTHTHVQLHVESAGVESGE